MDYTTVPCYNCICVPVCKHKSFHNLYFNCDLIRGYMEWSLDQSQGDYLTYVWIYAVLKPTQWNIDPEDNTRVLVTDAEGNMSKL